MKYRSTERTRNVKDRPKKHGHMKPVATVAYELWRRWQTCSSTSRSESGVRAEGRETVCVIQRAINVNCAPPSKERYLFCLCAHPSTCSQSPPSLLPPPQSCGM